MNRTILRWIRIHLFTGNTTHYNAERYHWRRIKLKLQTSGTVSR
jgi:ribosomal protein L39E